MILNGLAIAVVSFLLPWFLGPAFLRALVVIPLACLSVFLVADLVAESFAFPPAVPDMREFVGRAVALRDRRMGLRIGHALCRTGGDERHALGRRMAPAARYDYD